MVARAVVPDVADPGNLRPRHQREHKSRPFSLVIVWMWCGLVAGLLEVGTIILRKRVIGANLFFGVSRHFVWLIPVTNLLIFLGLGIVLALFAVWRPSRGRQLRTH